MEAWTTEEHFTLVCTVSSTALSKEPEVGAANDAHSRHAALRLRSRRLSYPVSTLHCPYCLYSSRDLDVIRLWDRPTTHSVVVYRLVGQLGYDAVMHTYIVSCSTVWQSVNHVYECQGNADTDSVTLFRKSGMKCYAAQTLLYACCMYWLILNTEIII